MRSCNDRYSRPRPKTCNPRSKSALKSRTSEFNVEYFKENNIRENLRSDNLSVETLCRALHKEYSV